MQPREKPVPFKQKTGCVKRTPLAWLAFANMLAGSGNQLMAISVYATEVPTPI